MHIGCTTQVHWRLYRWQPGELLDRMDRAQHAVLCGVHDAVGKLYKLPEEREVF